KAVEPGSITFGKRVTKAATGFQEPSGRGYAVGTELLSATGFRAVPVDIQQSLSFAAASYSKADAEATNIFSKVYGSRGTVAPGQVKAAYEELQASKQQLFEDMANKVKAAVNLGVPDKEIATALRGSGLSADDVKLLFAGRYSPYRTSKAIEKRAAASKDYAARRAEYIEAAGGKTLAKSAP